MPGEIVPASCENSSVSTGLVNSPQCLEEQCFEAWAEHHQSFADRRKLADTVQDQTWKCADWTVDHLRMRQFSTGAEEVVRRPEHVRRSFEGHLAFYVSQSGKRQVLVGDEVLSMQPDTIQVHDLNVPSRYTTQSSLSALAINVPYSSIGYDPSRHPGTMSFSTARPVGMMLHNAMMTICAESMQTTPSEAPKLAAGLCGLFRGLVMAKIADVEAQGEVASARRKLINAYIESHLYDPALDATVLCRQFGASRATMYRLFSADGGVATYLNDRRLVHAFRKLRSSPPSRGRIRTVAESLGFHDHSHFNRLFRQKFLITPSDAMGLWAETVNKTNLPN